MAGAKKIGRLYNSITTVKALLASFSVLFLCSCSSFFYHPSSLKFVDKNRIPVPPQDIYFESKNGSKLHAWYFPSLSKPSKGIILHIHGNAQNLTSHFFYLHKAPNAGYDHFIFDYQGYGDSEGKPSPEKVVQDAEAALRYLQKFNDCLPIFVFAQSLGGNIALRMLSNLRHPAIQDLGVQLLILDSTFASYRSVARQVFASNWLTWLFQPIAWLVVDNSQGVSARDVTKISPTPIWIIHGTKDRVIRFSQGEKLYAWAKEPKLFWPVPGGSHTSLLADTKSTEQFFQKLDDFVGANKSAVRPTCLDPRGR
jgi:uncharacterized protein